VNPERRAHCGVFFIFAALIWCLIPAGCGKHAPATIGSGADSIDRGMVVHTGNIQVARYVLRPHSPAQVTIEFGPTPAYGLKTWTVAAGPAHAADILVAGMRGGMVYHMRATVRFPDGTLVRDTDHTFRTGAYSPKLLPQIAVRQFGATQPGVELLNPTVGVYQAIATDLQGHVLWAYQYSDYQSLRRVKFHRDERALWLTLVGWSNWIRRRLGFHPAGRPFLWDSSMWKYLPPDQLSPTMIDPIKLLPNGNFLMAIGIMPGYLMQSPDDAMPPDTTLALREVNLAGETVRNLTVADLDRKLRATHYAGPRPQVLHHDIAVLPNGNFVVIAGATRNYTNLPGHPGTTRVLGDILVELDQNFNPVWTWSEFDHLDVNRHPIDFPDWTHTNAVVYTKDDGNLLLSMRTQHWVIKIDFRNGKGTGKVLWRLGPGGDFRLIGGIPPTDWNYGQHDPVIFGERDAGIFDLGMMDNGYGRVMTDGKVCGTKGAPACYSAAVVYRIDEKAKTATIIFRKVFPASQYSFWGGSVQNLAGGDIEVDLCSVDLRNSDIYDLTDTANPKPVWQMRLENATAYRTKRLGSLYPGIQW
jgi:arylsulfate sulfotransferase